MAVAAFALAIGNLKAEQPEITCENLGQIKTIHPAEYEAIAARGGPSADQTMAAIKLFIQTKFFDPYSVREIGIALPFSNTKATTHKDWIIQFSANAKNRMGGYVGRQTWTIMWKNGALDWPAMQNYYTWQGFIEGMREGLE